MCLHNSSCTPFLHWHSKTYLHLFQMNQVNDILACITCLFFKSVHVTLAFYHYPFLSTAKVLMNSDVHTTHTLLAIAAVAKVVWRARLIHLHKAPEDLGQGQQPYQPLCCPYCCQPLENLCQAPPPPLKGPSWRMHSAWPHRQAWYHPANYFFSEDQILLSTEVFREGERC